MANSVNIPMCALSRPRAASRSPGKGKKGWKREKDVQTNKFFEMSSVLIEVVEFFQLVSMNDDVKSTHLSQTELSVLNTSEANLFPCLGAVGLSGSIDSSLVLSQTDEGDRELGEVGNVVEEDLGGFEHSIVETTVSDL